MLFANANDIYKIVLFNLNRGYAVLFDDLYEMGADFLSYVVMGVIALIILIPFSIFAQILKSPKATLLLVLVAVVIIFVLFGFHEQLHRLVKEIIVKYINNSHQLQ